MIICIEINIETAHNYDGDEIHDRTPFYESAVSDVVDYIQNELVSPTIDIEDDDGETVYLTLDCNVYAQAPEVGQDDLVCSCGASGLIHAGHCPSGA